MNKKNANEMRELSNLINSQKKPQQTEREKLTSTAFDHIYSEMEKHITNFGDTKYSVSFICPVHTDREKIERKWTDVENTLDIPAKEVAEEFKKLGYTVDLSYHKDGWIQKMTISF